jgi:cysteinyl-tRNA synthetase
MHNGFIRIDSEKMSKSLGNFFTIREVLEQYQAEVIRYFMLTSQYRSPLNYSNQQLDSAKASLDRLYRAIRGLDIQNIEAADHPQPSQNFHTAMQDDFNTPLALSVLFGLVKEINLAKQNNELDRATALAVLMQKLAQPLGILNQDAEIWFEASNHQTKKSDTGLSDTEIDALIEQRNHARDHKNWSEADRIRDVLNENKITIKDASGVSTWQRG